MGVEGGHAGGDGHTGDDGAFTFCEGERNKCDKLRCGERHQRLWDALESRAGHISSKAHPLIIARCNHVPIARVDAPEVTHIASIAGLAE